MKRVLLSLPAGLTFDQLTEEQQAALASVMAQYVNPMPNTIEAAGHVLCDALTLDNFDPAVMPGLGLNWPVLGLWQWSGAGDLVTLVPLDPAVLLAHLPPVPVLDGEGNVIGETPPEAKMPHNWGGWPEVVL